jgi:hypothetical protein
MLGSYWDCRIEVHSVGKALLNDSRTGPATPTKCTLESAKVTKANLKGNRCDTQLTQPQEVERPSYANPLNPTPISDSSRLAKVLGKIGSF